MERENIARAAKGDANAFETLMGAYEKKIYALCLRMMGNPHDGEDAAQEAMLRIWRTIGQYRFESAFSTWVYRVTASCCMDAIRKRQRHEQPSLEEMGEASGFDPADGSETPQEQTERKETRSAIRQAIAAVPEGMREVFLLRDVHGLGYTVTAFNWKTQKAGMLVFYISYFMKHIRQDTEAAEQAARAAAGRSA